MADAKPPVFDPLEDLKAIGLILVVMWIVWFYTGGPQRYEQTGEKPFLKEPTNRFANDIWQDPFISEQYGSVPSVNANVNVNVGNGNGTQFKQPPAQSGGSSGLLTKPVSYITKGSSNTAGVSYIRIDYPASNSSPLQLTGSTIKDFFGHSATIPQASPLPYQGRLNKLYNVVVSPGSSIYFIQGQSPIGVSFRVNKCIGLLSQFQAFYPPLPTSPVMGLNYNDCVDAHKDDPDFYTNDWRIYLDQSGGVWNETGDLVRLIDPSGETLASVYY